MTTVVEFTVVASPDAWRSAGFTVGEDRVVRIGDVEVRLIEEDSERGGGITGWALVDAPDPHVIDLDGMHTAHIFERSALAEGVPEPHANTVTTIDHVVVQTKDLERTCAAIEAATGAPLRRVREVGTLRQGFHRLGELIVEVVTHPGVVVDRAEFWGLAFNVADIDVAFALCGEAVMSQPKDAVQPGRRIASFREGASLGTPVALMTPHVHPPS